MNTSARIALLGMAACLLWSCDKKPFDHRNKYIGDWNFDVKVSSFLGYPPLFTEDTFTYQGTIAYGAGEDAIEINYGPSMRITLNVDEEGKLSEFPSAYGGGSFPERYELHFMTRWGGLGGGVSHDVSGIKQ